jgi:hypothetical protein
MRALIPLTLRPCRLVPARTDAPNPRGLTISGPRQARAEMPSAGGRDGVAQ